MHRTASHLDRLPSSALHAATFPARVAAGPEAPIVQETQLAETLHELEPVRGWWDKLFRPAGFAAGVGNVPYLYCFRRYTIGSKSDQGIITGIEATMLPADTDGLGYTPGVTAYSGGGSDQDEALPWGDTRGRTAAILIGINLPIAGQGSWSQLQVEAPGNAPGSATDQGVRHNSSAVMSAAPYLVYQPFPGGTLSGSVQTAPPLLRTWSYGAAGPRLRLGDTLDMCLVLNRDQAIVDASLRRWVCGYCHVTAYVGLVTARRPFARGG